MPKRAQKVDTSYIQPAARPPLPAPTLRSSLTPTSIHPHRSSLRPPPARLRPPPARLCPLPAVSKRTKSLPAMRTVGGGRCGQTRGTMLGVRASSRRSGARTSSKIGKWGARQKRAASRAVSGSAASTAGGGNADEPEVRCWGCVPPGAPGRTPVPKQGERGAHQKRAVGGAVLRLVASTVGGGDVDEPEVRCWGYAPPPGMPGRTPVPKRGKWGSGRGRIGVGSVDAHHFQIRGARGPAQKRDGERGHIGPVVSKVGGGDMDGPEHFTPPVIW
ncbi:hypothetical protein B0H13DRAFT_1936231 [Mycena leptocephala]|nr:hypothetical protein B0H13DRAFT_1936231 [Mycena leptocephala]